MQGTVRPPLSLRSQLPQEFRPTLQCLFQSVVDGLPGAPVAEQGREQDVEIAIDALHPPCPEARKHEKVGD